MSVKHVICFQQRLTHYRETFFEQVKDQLNSKGIVFDLVHGLPDAATLSKNDSGHLSWAHVVDVKNYRFGKFSGVWVPLPKTISMPDLVVVTQENKLLANYAWLLRRFFGQVKIAYWGHGANFQSDVPAGLRERFKQLLLTRVDWWFAYTQMTVDILKKSGYPTAQITNLNNAIDTDAFRGELAAVSDTELSAARDEFGIVDGAAVGIFCGSLYPDKKLDFLVAAIDIIRLNSPDFHCIVLGDGPSMPYMREAAASRPWLHLMGVTKGAKKALYFRMAEFMLNPGLVGLHVVDAFCAGLVMATTSGARHSPEVCYLHHGVNGIMTGDSVEEYAQAILDLIADPLRLQQYRSAALADADVYTLDNMVSQFVDGIVRCLGK